MLHANALNFDRIERVLKAATARGYEFVSLDEAVADPAYGVDVPPRGSWIHGWRELRGLEHRPDPDPAAALGVLLEDYRLVNRAHPEGGAPLTPRVADRAV